MSDAKVYYAGNICPASELKIPFLNNSFLYGHGLFETCLVRQKKVIFLEEHLNRLRSSLSQFEIDLKASNAEIKTICEHLISDSKEGVLKIHLSQNLESYDLSTSKKEEVLLIYFTPQLSVQSSSPLICLSSPHYKSLSTLLAKHKLSSYVYPFLLKKEASSAKVDEIILQDDCGNLTEASTSNLFFAFENTLVTPSLEQALLPGVTRKIILEIAVNQGLKVEERAVHESEIGKFSEAFLSSSVSMIRTIAQFNQHSFTALGRVSSLLMKALEEKIDSF